MMEDPRAALASYAADVLPSGASKTISVFGVRATEKHISATLRIGQKFREPLLMSSGKSAVYFKDIIRPGTPAPTDVTVIWSRLSPDQLLAIGVTTPGYRGLACNERGHGLRVHPAHLAEARKVLFADDDRYTEGNWNVVISSHYECQGFPPGTTAGMVIAALIPPTADWGGWAVVPIRAWTTRGLQTWLVGTASPPPVTEVTIGDSRILIQQAQDDRSTRRKPAGPQQQQKPPLPPVTQQPQPAAALNAEEQGRPSNARSTAASHAMVVRTTALEQAITELRGRMDASDSHVGQLATRIQGVEALQQRTIDEQKSSTKTILAAIATLRGQ
jgi:hypothetical protein